MILSETLVRTNDADFDIDRIKFDISRTTSVSSKRSNGKQQRKMSESVLDTKCKRQEVETINQTFSEDKTHGYFDESENEESVDDDFVLDESDDFENHENNGCVDDESEVTVSDNDSDIENIVSSADEDNSSVVNVAKRNVGRSSIKRPIKSTKENLLMLANISKDTVEGCSSEEQKFLVSCDKTGLGIELNAPVEISTSVPYETKIFPNDGDNAIANKAENLLQRSWIGCRLKLLNVSKKFHSNEYLPTCLLEPKFNVPRNRLINIREEVSLVYDVDHEEIKINERHPVLAQQATLLRSLCLFNGFDARDVRGIFST